MAITEGVKFVDAQHIAFSHMLAFLQRLRLIICQHMVSLNTAHLGYPQILTAHFLTARSQPGRGASSVLR